MTHLAQFVAGTQSDLLLTQCADEFSSIFINNTDEVYQTMQCNFILIKTSQLQS